MQTPSFPGKKKAFVLALLIFISVIFATMFAFTRSRPSEIDLLRNEMPGGTSYVLAGSCPDIMLINSSDKVMPNAIANGRWVVVGLCENSLHDMDYLRKANELAFKISKRGSLAIFIMKSFDNTPPWLNVLTSGELEDGVATPVFLIINNAALVKCWRGLPETLFDASIESILK